MEMKKSDLAFIILICLFACNKSVGQLPSDSKSEKSLCIDGVKIGNDTSLLSQIKYEFKLSSYEEELFEDVDKRISFVSDSLQFQYDQFEGRITLNHLRISCYSCDLTCTDLIFPIGTSINEVRSKYLDQFDESVRVNYPSVYESGDYYKVPDFSLLFKISDSLNPREPLGKIIYRFNQGMVSEIFVDFMVDF
jgi:hypothetical protein